MEWAFAIKKSLEDGFISPEELKGIKKESLEFSAAIAEAMNRLESLVQDSARPKTTMLNK